MSSKISTMKWENLVRYAQYRSHVLIKTCTDSCFTIYLESFIAFVTVNNMELIESVIFSFPIIVCPLSASRMRKV